MEDFDKTIENLEKKNKEFNFHELKTGELNYETPIKNFLLNILKINLNSYIIHEEINLIPPSQTHFIFILKEFILITKTFDFAQMNSIGYFSEFIIEKINYLKIFSINSETLSNSSIINLTIFNSDNFENKENFKFYKFCFDNYYSGIINMNIIEKLIIKNYQIFFENNVPINLPLFYIEHFFVKKINTKKKIQKRIILITNKLLLNIFYNKINLNENNFVFEINKIKWAISLESLNNIEIINKNELKLKINFDKKINKKKVNELKFTHKDKKNYIFIFYNLNNFNKFIYQIKNLFSNLTQKDLQILNL